MTKIKSNAAEIIIATVATILLMSSCGSQYGVCPAYAQNNQVTQECENCDELN